MIIGVRLVAINSFDDSSILDIIRKRSNSGSYDQSIASKNDSSRTYKTLMHRQTGRYLSIS